MDGCFPTAFGRQQPLATFWDLPFSHSDASISRKVYASILYSYVSILFPSYFIIILNSMPVIQFIHILIRFHWHTARHQLCIIIIIIIINACCKPRFFLRFLIRFIARLFMKLFGFHKIYMQLFHATFHETFHKVFYIIIIIMIINF